MSFFQKFNNNDYNFNYSLHESIKNKISLIFENRGDLYYSYNFKTKEIVPIHRLLRIDFFDVNYIKFLKKSILAIESRIQDVEIKLIQIKNSIFFEITCFLEKDLLNFSIKVKE